MLEQYNFIPIVTVVLISYVITWSLAKTNKIKLLTHRRLWNSILAISFFMSATLGFVITMAIELGFRIPYYTTVRWIHVEFGLILFIVALFHFLWHLPYYAAMLKKKHNPEHEK